MITWEPITLSARDGTSQPAETGTLYVPEYRANPASYDLALKVVRIRASNPVGAPPVVFLSGGPGDSGIQWATHGPFLRAFQRVAQSVDVLLLDQRHTGDSERDYSVPFPLEIPANAVRDAWSAYRFLEGHVASRWHVLREIVTPAGVTAVESAEDLEALRRGLGVERLSLWGYSYGTHLAQMAMRALPTSLDRVVLCGFEGPDQTFKLPSQLDAQLQRLHDLAVGQGFDFLGSLTRVHARLEDAPVTIETVLTRGEPPTTLQVGAFALRHLTSMWCSLSNRFDRLPKLYAALDRGETGPLAEALPLYCRHWARSLTFYFTDAASGASPARWDRILAEAPTALLENAANFPFPEIGRVIQAADLGSSLRRPVTSERPCLVLTGGLDGFTPTANFLESAPGLPNATHVEVGNAAHNDLIASPEAVDGIAKFLATGRLDQAGPWSVQPPRFAE